MGINVKIPDTDCREAPRVLPFPDPCAPLYSLLPSSVHCGHTVLFLSFIPGLLLSLSSSFSLTLYCFLLLLQTPTDTSLPQGRCHNALAETQIPCALLSSAFLWAFLGLIFVYLFHWTATPDISYYVCSISCLPSNMYTFHTRKKFNVLFCEWINKWVNENYFF